jgi:AhpD family alkylhydroperoxidase
VKSSGTAANETCNQPKCTVAKFPDLFEIGAESKRVLFMATIPLVSDEEASDRVLAVFNDIRETRGTDFINNFWRALANDPENLNAVWAELKVLMGPGALDPVVKEMIYIAVSTANNCSYCIHSHTAAARAKGMSDEQHLELVKVIGMAGRTNHLVNAMQIPVDPEFQAVRATGNTQEGIKSGKEQ